MLKETKHELSVHLVRGSHPQQVFVAGSNLVLHLQKVRFPTEAKQYRVRGARV